MRPVYFFHKDDLGFEGGMENIDKKIHQNRSVSVIKTNFFFKRNNCKHYWSQCKDYSFKITAGGINRNVKLFLLPIKLLIIIDDESLNNLYTIQLRRLSYLSHTHSYS